jgi:hypothetical protein
MLKRLNFKSLLFFFIVIFVFIGIDAQAGLLTSDNVQTAAGMTREAAGFNNMSIGDLVAQIFKIALSLLGVIFLIIMVFAGYRWMTASGNEEAITSSKAAIKRAIIGLIIVISAYAITHYVFSALPFSGNIQGGGGTTVNPEA